MDAGDSPEEDLEVQLLHADHESSERPSERPSEQAVEEDARKGAGFGAGINLANALIGSGLLALPYAFAESGLLGGAVQVVPKLTPGLKGDPRSTLRAFNA